MSFAEFEQLPDPAAGRYELVHGEVILVPPAAFPHYEIQTRLQQIFAALTPADLGRSCIEFPFRSNDINYYVCDVAWIDGTRWKANSGRPYFEGAPELMVEVVSPSNTASEMLEKEKVSLSTGAQQFWLVSADLRQIKVSTPDGHTITYKAGDRIPLFFAEGKTVEVDSVFA